MMIDPLALIIGKEVILPRGSGYSSRPSVVLENAWELIDASEFSTAWEILDSLQSSKWSAMLRPEILWASYTAGEAARIDDSILESYLTELVDEYPGTDFGRAARDRLIGGEEEGGV